MRGTCRSILLRCPCYEHDECKQVIWEIKLVRQLSPFWILIHPILIFGLQSMDLGDKDVMLPVL